MTISVIAQIDCVDHPSPILIDEPVTVSQGINWGGLAPFASGVTAAAALIDNRK